MIMWRIATVVLHYNTPQFTIPLAQALREQTYGHQQIYIVDHHSTKSCNEITHPLERNMHFTRGMFEAWKIARSDANYDAYWLLNNDLMIPPGTLTSLVRVLFSDDTFAQIAPAHNSPHDFMTHPGSKAQAAPSLEATATLIKGSTFERIGFWDLRLTRGWGIEADYGFRVRQAGLLNILTNRARIVHYQHGTLGGPFFAKFCAYANAEMNRIMRRKYGKDWKRLVEWAVR